MKWWLIVYIFTPNGWVPGEIFDGWGPIEQTSFQACIEQRDFSNQINSEAGLSDKICFACQKRWEHETKSKEKCEGPCAPCDAEAKKIN